MPLSVRFGSHGTKWNEQQRPQCLCKSTHVRRDVLTKNRIWVSPMCQYSAGVDGLPTTWHLVHLGSRAVGGAGVVMAEATAVLPEGRISPADVGLWSDEHIVAWAPIAAFIEAQGSVPAIQLAHAGRKASCATPWAGAGQLTRDAGGWETVGPSSISYSDATRPPREMTAGDFDRIKDAFVSAAVRAVATGFRVIEIHAAHGYLLHECLSPASNKRSDAFGGSLSARIRWPVSVAEAVRAAIPSGTPLVVRISATDWAPDARPAWDLPQSIELCRALQAVGVDMSDVSSGGNLADARMTLGPGYQVRCTLKRTCRRPVFVRRCISHVHRCLSHATRDVCMSPRHPARPSRGANTSRYRSRPRFELLCLESSSVPSG